MRKLEKLAVEKNKPLERIILPLVNRVGVVEAAKQLGYAPSTISKWLTDNGYAPSTTWGKATSAQERADIEAAHDRVNQVRQAEGLPSIEEEVEAL